MCHESSGLGLTESIGIGKSTVKIEDFSYADSIFIIGQNPGTCHPRMLSELQKAARNGCKIVSVNPLPETGMIRFKNPQEPLSLLGRGTEIASLFLPVRVNGDVALLKGIMKEMLEADRAAGGKLLAHDFIAHHTEGFEALVRDLDAASWEAIVRESGVSRALIGEGAKIALASERMICCWAMGITQHENGVANVQSIVNFALLRGQIGRRGAGLCPVRGHSNVQGDRTVGIWEKMSPAFLAALGREFGFTPPDKHGLDTVKTIQAMHDGRVKVFVGAGRKLPQRLARHQLHRRGDGALPADGADRHQAQSRPPHHRPDGADSPLPRSHRTRHAEVGRAVRDRRGHHRRGPPVARRPAARLGAPAERAGHRRRGWRSPRSAPGPRSTGRG